MSLGRRNLLLTFLATLAAKGQILDQDPAHPHKHETDTKDEARLPDGKSQKDAIAKQDYEQSVRDAEALVAAAESLRDDLKKEGSHIVSVADVRKTEEIEKLARKIRARLKA